MTMPQSPNGKWRVDHNVPLPLIVSLVILFGAQFIGFIVWGTNATTRLEAVERAIVSAAPQADRLTRVEVKVDGVQRTLDKIEALVQRRPGSAIGQPD